MHLWDGGGVANVGTQYKRAFLRWIKYSAEKSGVSLMDALTAALVARVEDTSNGRILSGTSGNGHSVTFQVPSSADHLSPANITELCEELITRLEESAAYLSKTTTGGDDGVLFADVLERLQPVKRMRHDYTLLRAQG